MEPTRYIIKKQFLDPHKYQQLLHHTFNYETLFKTWLGQIVDNYRGSQRPQPFVLNRNDTSIELTKQGLHNLIYPFVIKLYDISNQHLNYVSGVMRQSAAVSVQRDTDKVVERVKQLNQSLHHFEGQYRDLLSSENRIVLQPTHNIEFYYYSNWFKRLNQLEKYAKTTQSFAQCKPDKEKLYTLSEEVEYQLLQLRKRIMDYKYGYLRQGVKLSRQLLKCLSEYLTIGIQILSKINGKIKLQLASDTQNLRGLRYSSSFGSETDHMHDIRENYESKSEAFRSTLTNIQSLFIFRQTTVDRKVLFSDFEHSYSGNEHLLAQMFDVYTLFETMSNKRKIMNEKLSLLLNKIQNETKSKRKVAEVLSPLNRRKSLEESRNLGGGIESSRMTMSQQFDTKIILKSFGESIEYALKSFTELSQMCVKASARATEQKQIENNMEISYQYKEIKIKNKRPSHQQIWLWKDWRQFRVFNQVTPRFNQKLIKKELEEIRKIMQEGEDTQEKISCQIEGKNSSRATLEITPQRVQVTSKKDGAANFILPFKYIEEIQPRKKKLIIKMNGGAELKLSEFKNVVEVEKKINEFFLARSEPLSGKDGPMSPLKPAIAITPEELEAIQKRMPEMQTVKPNIKEFKKYAETVIKGISIQEVYQNIYSDKDGCLLNKNLPFFTHVNLKNGNINMTSTKYDQIGPYFYTGINKDITFLNCPLKSNRESEFDHPLPPIPFLPKSTHCKSEESMYWISNKELQYKADVRSYGNKMMESFYTSTMYVVKEDGENVSIEVLCKVEFKKDATMKSILANGVDGEIKALVPEILKDIEKCCRLAIKARARQGSATQNLNPEQDHKQEQEQQQKLKSKASTDMKDQSKINRTIIFLIIGTIVVNILINLIF